MGKALFRGDVILKGFIYGKSLFSNGAGAGIGGTVAKRLQKKVIMPI